MDISAAAIEKAKARLGQQSQLVKWVAADVTQFKTDQHYDLWHDRATFYFMTTERQIAAYLQIAGRAVTNYMLVGTFQKMACSMQRVACKTVYRRTVAKPVE